MLGFHFEMFRRMDRIIVTGKEKEYCSVFTVEVEESSMWHIQNKNR